MAQIPYAPAVAVIDEQNYCSLLWEPPLVAGTTAIYGFWKVALKDSPSATDANAYFVQKPGVTSPTEAVKITGLELGVNLSRAFGFTVTPGYHALCMHAIPASGILADAAIWSDYRAFPATRMCTLDKSTASKNEPITITLGESTIAGDSGDRWQVTYSDSSSSGWMPVSRNIQVKTFGSAGDHEITIMVEADYSTATPAVKLRRTVTRRVYIQDQDFVAPSSAPNPADSTTGLGGNAGFEISTASDLATHKAPYLTMASALVRDMATHELKLLVAATRGRDASSVKGTMALDVFPLPGRPTDITLLTHDSEILSSTTSTYELVRILDESLPDIVVGKNMVPIKLKAADGVTPYKWFSSSLPKGLTLSVDGTLVGTPLTLGRFSITISVQDSQNPPATDEKTYTLTAKSDLSIVTKGDAASNPGTGEGMGPGITTPTVGTKYSFQMVAQKGVLPYTWTIASGSLPRGLSLAPDGLIQGWPTSVTSDTDFDTPKKIILQVTDAIGAKVSGSFTVQLQPQPLTIGEPDQASLVCGIQHKLRFPIYGGRSVVGGTTGFSITSVEAPPNLLNGAVKIVNGAVEVLISEAFTTDSATTIQLAVSVGDLKGNAARKSVMLQVYPGADFTKWAAHSMASKLYPGSTVTQRVSGTPSGLSFSSLDVTPALPGITITPSITQGVISFGMASSASLVQEMVCQVTVMQGGLLLGKISRPYTLQALTAGTPAVWSVKAFPVKVGDTFAFDVVAPYPAMAPVTPHLTGERVVVAVGSALPPGVSLDSVTGTVYGTFLSSTGNPIATTFEVAKEGVVSARVSITWQPLGTTLVIPGALPEAKVGQLYGGSDAGHALNVLGGSGGLTPTLIRGRLPEGLTLDAVPGQSQIAIRGRVLEAGYFDVSIQVTDSAGRLGLISSRLVVSYLPYLAVITPATPKAIKGASYSLDLQATGGQAPYLWAMAPGSQALPMGITLDSSGMVSGTYNGLQDDVSIDIVYRVTDSLGQSVDKTLRFVVGLASPLRVTNYALPEATVGVAYLGVQLQAEGGVFPYTWSVRGEPALPEGLALDPATGILKGTPTVHGRVSVKFQVTDSTGTQAVQVRDVTVMAATAFRITNTSLPQARVGTPFGAAEQASIRVGATPDNIRTAGNSVLVNLGGRPHILNVCGLGMVRFPAYAEAFYDPTAEPDLFDPSTVISGKQVGSWLRASNFKIKTNPMVVSRVLSPANIKDRFFAASVQISPTQFVLLGGARMGNLGFGYAGTQGRTIYPGTVIGGTEELCPIVFVTVVESLPPGDADAGYPALLLSPGPTLPGMTSPDTGGVHGACATLLPNGHLFLAGGTSIRHKQVGTQAGMEFDTYYTGKEAFTIQVAGNPADSVVTRVADMPVALVCAKATTLLDGRVLVIGGLIRTGNLFSNNLGSNTCIIFDPATGAWSQGPTLPSLEFSHSITRLSDGRVVYGGGNSAGFTSFYVLNPGITAWVALLSHTDHAPNGWGSMVTLADDTVVYCSGTDAPACVVPGLTSIKGVFNVDPTMYPSAAALEAANYTGTYIFGAEAHTKYPYYIDPGTIGGGKAGINLAAAGGVPPYHTWGIVGPVIPGITVGANTGLLSGTPTIGFDELVSFTVSDSTTPTELITTKSIRVTCLDPSAPVWVTTSLPSGKAMGVYNQQLQAKDLQGVVLTGNYSISPFTVYGLPPGILLSPSGAITGKTIEPWQHTTTFRVTHPAHPTWFSDIDIELKFIASVGIVAGTPPQVIPGQPYSYSLVVVDGRPPYSFGWDASGEGLPPGLGGLPPGLVINTSTGVISGTPDVQPDKDFGVALSVTDANGVHAWTVFTFQVRNTVVVITNASEANMTPGAPFSLTLTATGGSSPYTWDGTSGLPAGMTLSGNVISANASATLAYTQASYAINLQCKDKFGVLVNKNITLKTVAATYVWSSGQQYAGVTPAGTKDNFILGAVWDREPYPYGYRHNQAGKAWVIRVSKFGDFNGSPTLNLGVTGWEAVLIRTVGGDAWFKVLKTNTQAFDSFSCKPTLTDGSQFAVGPTYTAVRKTSSCGDFPPGERIATLDGTEVTDQTVAVLDGVQGLVRFTNQPDGSYLTTRPNGSVVEEVPTLDYGEGSKPVRIARVQGAGSLDWRSSLAADNPATTPKCILLGYGGAAIPAMTAGVSTVGWDVIQTPWQMEDGTSMKDFANLGDVAKIALPSGAVPLRRCKVLFAPLFQIASIATTATLKAGAAAQWWQLTLAKPLNPTQDPTITVTSSIPGAVTPAEIIKAKNASGQIDRILARFELGSVFVTQPNFTVRVQAGMVETFLRGLNRVTETLNFDQTFPVVVNAGADVTPPTITRTTRLLTVAESGNSDWSITTGNPPEVCGTCVWAKVEASDSQSGIKQIRVMSRLVLTGREAAFVDHFPTQPATSCLVNLRLPIPPTTQAVVDYEIVAQVWDNSGNVASYSIGTVRSLTPSIVRASLNTRTFDLNPNSTTPTDWTYFVPRTMGGPIMWPLNAAVLSVDIAGVLPSAGEFPVAVYLNGDPNFPWPLSFKQVNADGTRCYEVKDQVAGNAGNGIVSKLVAHYVEAGNVSKSWPIWFGLTPPGGELQKYQSHLMATMTATGPVIVVSYVIQVQINNHGGNGGSGW